MTEACERAYLERWEGPAGLDDWCEDHAGDIEDADAALRLARDLGDRQARLAILPFLLDSSRRLYPERNRRLALECIELAGTAETGMRALRAACAASRELVTSAPVKGLDVAQSAVWMARQLERGAGGSHWTTLALSMLATAAALQGNLALAESTLAQARANDSPDVPAPMRVWRWNAERMVADLRRDREALIRVFDHYVVAMRDAGIADLGFAEVDIQLVAGRAAEALALARELLSQMGRMRAQPEDVAYLELNQVYGLLACGRLDEVTPLMPLSQAAFHRRDMHCNWADALALHQVLAGRPADAARLLGWADRQYERLATVRTLTDEDIAERALAGLRQALDEATIGRLRADGAALDELGAWTLVRAARDDAAAPR